MSGVTAKIDVMLVSGDFDIMRGSGDDGSMVRESSLFPLRREWRREGDTSGAVFVTSIVEAGSDLAFLSAKRGERRTAIVNLTCLLARSYVVPKLWMQLMNEENVVIRA